MIRSHSHKQLSLAEFGWPFQTALDEDNRWVKMSECIPWDALSEGYCQSLSVRQGRPAKDARLVIAAVIIKHKLCLSDEATVAQIQENPYLQYFAGCRVIRCRRRSPPHCWSRSASGWVRRCLSTFMAPSSRR